MRCTALVISKRSDDIGDGVPLSQVILVLGTSYTHSIFGTSNKVHMRWCKQATKSFPTGHRCQLRAWPDIWALGKTIVNGVVHGSSVLATATGTYRFMVPLLINLS